MRSRLRVGSPGSIRRVTTAKFRRDSCSLQYSRPSPMGPANPMAPPPWHSVHALTIALFAAALILGAVFRSGRAAWIGLACNFLPILLVYSVWAVVDGQISIGAAVVMGMVLGIVLDDTIYLLATYDRGVQRNPDDPVGYALQRVGPAMIVTTITLIAGLSLGLLSDFGPIWSMSVLSVAIIGTALVVDLLLLPALLPVNGFRRSET